MIIPKRRQNAERTVRLNGRTFRVPSILTKETGSALPVVPLHDIVMRVVALAQVLAEKKYYPYQVQFAYRLVESVLLRDGNTITALFSRQSGKTEVVSTVICALLVIMPILAKQYPHDWRFNLTDDTGRYRGFRKGIRIGIYAPKASQAEIMYNRVRAYLETNTAKKVLAEQKIIFDVSNGDTVKLSSGSRLLCQTASENAKIEGQTHDLLVAEEAQDISDKKIKKSLNPMVASTKGTIVMIGTAATRKCAFYDSIKTNERTELMGRKRNHFFYPWRVCAKYNSLYKDYIEQEKDKIGETSDEFLLSYECLWLFERGMFVSHQQLFNNKVALCHGQPFSRLYTPEEAQRLPPNFEFVAGIDWGRDHDSTVVTIVAVDWQNPVLTSSVNTEKGRIDVSLYAKTIIHWAEWHGDNYEHQFAEITRLLDSFGIRLRKIVTDSNTCGKPIYDRLTSIYEDRDIQVVPFNFSAKMKSDGYKAFYAELCGRRFSFPADVSVRKGSLYRKFVQQMLDLRKVYKNGLMSVAHPDEKHAHDDFPDSAMMANWGTLEAPFDSAMDFSDTNPFMG